MAHLLIVEDDLNVASALKALLVRIGYQTTVVNDSHLVMSQLDEQSFDLILLDLNLGDPLLDGLALCRAIRSRPNYLPIIMVTVRDSTVDKVVGLEMGADDYLVKPFEEQELIARIRSTLRTVQAAGRTQQADKQAVLQIDQRLTIDPHRHRVYRDNEEILLTPREFELLLYLATNAGRPFGRSMLLDQVWGWDYAGDTRTVDKHIAELRRKLEDDPANPQYILTLHGVGYSFRDW